jgi:hypothetical protein
MGCGGDLGSQGLTERGLTEDDDADAGSVPAIRHRCEDDCH